MCGRFARQIDKERLVESFRRFMPDLECDDMLDLTPRFNISPSQNVLTIGRSQGKAHPKFAALQWGLVPHFSKDPMAPPAPINVRSETVAEKPMFRTAIQKRRCLVVADGFYEWKKEGTRKQPFYFAMADGQPFAFAGIYDVWKGGPSPIVSCAILTTDANEVLRPVHDRMPVILAPKDYVLWCDPDMQDAARVRPLLRPYPSGLMKGHPVSTAVGNPRNEGPSLIRPIELA